MIRLGIVDCDTSHVEQFTKRLHHVDMPEDQWVDGAQVVMAYPGTSAILAADAIEKYVAELRRLGVRIVERPEEMIGGIDGVLVESQSGLVHLERARPFLEAGIPCYVDKPFACSLADAREMAQLAARRNVPLFSASSLRYALEIQELRNAGLDRALGADVHSPASLHPANPGLFHYGIHGVEMLFTLMGPGCREVMCACSEGSEVTTGIWDDGRIGTMRGNRCGGYAYGFAAWGEKEVHRVTINTAYIYRELLKRIVGMFETGQAPLAIEETLEIVAFQEAALESARRDGAKTALPR